MTTKQKIRISVTVVLCLLTLVVIFQNTEVVETKILLARISMPRALLLAVTFLAGMASGLILANHFTRKRKT